MIIGPWKEKVHKMRAVIYARYSSDKQSENSADDQISSVSKKLSERGITVVSIFKDEAISGTTTQRPGLESMMTLARARGFDMVAAEALDRISRDQADIAAIYKELAFLDVQMWTVEEGDIDQLHIGLKGTMNALFIDQLKQKIKRGHIGQLERGKNPCGKAYGYNTVPKLMDDGQVERGNLVINEEQAEVVRRIFQEYADGMSTRHIAHGLNRDGIPSARGREWRPSVISGNKGRGQGILWNPIYAGILVYNRVRAVLNPETGKKIRRPNPPSEWMQKEMPHLRIVPDDLFKAVQARKAAASKNYPLHLRRRPRTVLQNLIKCGHCGGSYSQRSKDYLSCSKARDTGTCSNKKTIRRSVVETRVFAALKEWLLDPAMIQEYVTEYHKAMADMEKKSSSHRSRLERKLRETDARCIRLANAIADNLDSDTVRQQLMENEALKKELESQLHEMGANNVTRIHPNAAEKCKHDVLNLEEALKTTTDSPRRAKAMETVRSLIDIVTITPGKKRGEEKIEVEGTLAGAINLIIGSTGQKYVMNGNLPNGPHCHS